LEEAGSAVACGSPEAAVPLLAAELMRRGRRKLLVVVPSGRGLERRVAEMRTALDLVGLVGVAAAALPEPARSPYEELPVHTAVLAARAEATARLYGDGGAAIVVPAGALRWGLASPGRFRGAERSVGLGDRIEREELARHLVRIGYARRQLVGEPGEFAVRGYVFDVFSPDRGLPARIELFGDRVESVRSFDTSTQRSLGTLDGYHAIPLQGLPLAEEEEAELRASLGRRSDLGEEARELRCRQLRRGQEGPWLWLERAARAALTSPAGALPDDGLVVLADREEVGAALAAQDELWRAQRREAGAGKRPAMPVADPLADLRSRAIVELTSLAMVEDGNTVNLGLGRAVGSSEEGTAAAALGGIEEICRSGGCALVVMGSEGHARRAFDRLDELGARAIWVPDPGRPPGDVVASLREKRVGAAVVTCGALRSGFLIAAAGLRLVAHSELFGTPPRPRRLSSRAAAFGSSVSELKVGDFVVHADHGIGIFDGLRTIRRGTQVIDVVRVVYAGGDRLLLPVDKLGSLQRYSVLGDAAGGESGPRLDRLGSGGWERVKVRVRRSVRRMAGELLDLYAVRKTIRGLSHAPDDERMRALERSFPYEETPDQLRAMDQIKADMESERPMDRLLCGDVGYGKTELAVRAAVKAAVSGRQTAVLAPTTVLAQQHYETFRARLRGFPFDVGLLSRFLTPARQREVVGKAREGRIDIVVGTHRLLGRDVDFRNLGLLVVDEEQRFGVGHKERLKALRKRVDVLTMTATPIPRTLSMSLAGLRDMSLIETPPKNRLAIRTELLTFDRETVRRAVAAELERDGQVFYLHNRVESIGRAAAMLTKLVPEASVAVAHARMPSAELEGVMSRFVAGEHDVLVTTSIIENGLDIPRANTLIVERADRFGLAQLYQLRGRVGRSDRPAYAFLLVPPLRTLSAVARRRLRAIREFSELGSGFRLAAVDLEIRGAGNLLGAEQSGHIEAVGFELYNRMLEQAVRELRGEVTRAEFRTELNLGLDLHIPDDYMPDQGSRMRIYSQVADAESEGQLELLAGELADLYGPPPRSVSALLRYAALKLRASAMRLERIDREGGELAIRFTPDAEVSGEKLTALVASTPGARFTSSGVLFCALDAAAGVLEEATKLLHSLGG